MRDGAKSTAKPSSDRARQGGEPALTETVARGAVPAILAHLRRVQTATGVPGAEPGDPTPAATGPSPDPASAAWVEVERRTSTMLVVMAAFSAAIAIAIGFLLAEAVIRPLRDLGHDAAVIAGGDLAHRSRTSGRHDEIGELGRSFDTMAEALQRSDECRRRFLQDAAHELGTPVTAIHTTVSAILDGVYEPDRRHLEIISDETRLLGRIVDDLRTIALAEAGHLPLACEDCDLTAVARSVADAFAAKAAHGRCSLMVEAAGAAISRGDPDRVRQVLSALVDNALRHAPKGGHVSIASHQAGGWAVVEVLDDGPGLGDQPERLFDRFFRADAPPDRTSGHAGLGLAIVRALVEAQGGSVTAANRCGGGASFRVELPAGA